MKFLLMVLSLMGVIFAAMGGLTYAPHAHIKGEPHDAGCGRGPPPPPPTNSTG